MKKKWALLFAAGLLSMTVLSGCGGEDYDIIPDEDKNNVSDGFEFERID